MERVGMLCALMSTIHFLTFMCSLRIDLSSGSFQLFLAGEVSR